MKKIFWGAVFLVPSLLLPLVPAVGATQLSVYDSPSLSGPLSAGTARCSTKLERDFRTDPDPKNGTDKDQVVMARVRLCSWLVSYDPKEENDSSRDYGIAYVQTSIDSRNGYCVGQANTKLRIPYTATTYGHSPDKSVTVASPRRKNVRLFINASGHGPAATLAQHYLLYPKELKALVKQKEKGELFVSRYNGRAKDNQKLAFAEGVKISWLASEGSPSFLPRLNYSFIIPSKATNRVCG